MNLCRKSQKLIPRPNNQSLGKREVAMIATRSPRLTKDDLSTFKAELSRMERAGEITMGEYMTLTEDISVIEGRRS